MDGWMDGWVDVCMDVKWPYLIQDDEKNAKEEAEAQALPIPCVQCGII
jgi:hypothetical protein